MELDPYRIKCCKCKIYKKFNDLEFIKSNNPICKKCNYDKLNNLINLENIDRCDLCSDYIIGVLNKSPAIMLIKCVKTNIIYKSCHICYEYSQLNNTHYMINLDLGCDCKIYDISTCNICCQNKFNNGIKLYGWNVWNDYYDIQRRL